MLVEWFSGHFPEILSHFSEIISTAQRVCRNQYETVEKIMRRKSSERPDMLPVVRWRISSSRQLTGAPLPQAVLGTGSAC
jgi:hypothetical protein